MEIGSTSKSLFEFARDYLSSTSKTYFDFALDYTHSDFALDYLASANTHFDFALDCLHWLDLTRPGLDLLINLLKMKVRIVKTFAVHAGKWKRRKLFYLGGDEEGGVERLDCVLSRIPHVLCSVTKRIRSAYLSKQIRSAYPKSDEDEVEFGAQSLVSTLEEQIEHLGREIEDLYIILVDDYPLGDPHPRRLTDLIDSLADISQDLRWYYHYYHCNDLPDQLIALLEKLMFLKNFISFATVQLQGGVVEHMQLMDLLFHVESVAINAARLIHTWWVDISDTQVREKIHFESSQLLHKIKPVDADPTFRQICIHVLAASKLSRSSHTYTLVKNSHAVVANFIDYLLGNLMDILLSCTNFMLYVKNQMKILHARVTFLKKLFGEWPEKFNALDDEMKDLIGVVACDAGILIFSLSENEMKEGLAKETDIELCHLLKVVQFIMAEVAQIYPPTSSSLFSFPMTNELGFLDFLRENLQELASCEANSIVFLKDRIQNVQEDLSSLRSFLEEIGEQRNKNEKLQTLWTRVIEVAYKTEYVIDSILVGDKPDCSSPSLDTITEEIKFIETEIKFFKTEDPEIYGNVSRDSQAQRVTTETLIHMPSKVGTPAVNEVLVGLDVEVKTIIDGLTRGSKQLDIVSIVGMPGLGKTTLANRVYNDPLIVHHFHVRAWCTVSQEYSKQRLLLQILGDNDLKMNEDDLAEKVYKHLKRKTYLIVLDDVWDIEAWNLLKASFPTDNNGSRILFTSRFHSLCSLFKSDCKPHNLRTLTDEECWELLQYKLFGKEGCTPALSTIGMKIAKDCKGLPLTVVIVAGILSNIEQNCWEEVANNLSSSTVIETEYCMQTLELSYRYLPDYLKPCLIYFGAFQEDQEILVRKLKLLWISEGFVQKIEVKSLEDIVEDYLMELIGRSLVMVTQQRSVGGVKACRIHDLLHEFCVAKAKEESFLQILHGYNEHVSFTGLYNTYRLGIYSRTTVEELEKSRLFFPYLRFLLVFHDRSGIFDRGVNNSFNFQIFKLLRVLDFGFLLGNERFLKEIELLVHLRYLALCFDNLRSIPAEIANLSRLESFLLEIPMFGSVKLPDTIWNMKKLRHLCVKVKSKFIGAGFSLSTDNLDVFPDLCHLDTFSLAIDPSSQSLQTIVTKLPSIRRLKCFEDIREYSTMNCSRILELGSLSRLESLHVAGFRRVEFVFPQVLKKLALTNCKLPWNEISTVGQLPNLEVLKLLSGAVVGETWEMKEGEFPKLRFLQLENLEIVRWTASCDIFPCLQKLILVWCRKLEELPSGLGDIPNIEMIEVRECHPSAVSLVKQIQQEQMEFGNDYLKIIIHAYSDSDSDSNT